MTSWIFDNVGDTSMETLKAEIAGAGGKLEEELKKLEKGGVVAVLESKTAATTMCKMADWFASRKIRCHLPKSVLSGTAKLVIKNLPTDYDEDDIVTALADEGLEVVEMYMFRKQGNATGMVKVTAKAGNTVKSWLARGQGEIQGVRIRVERQRTAMKCFNCNKIGHRASECKESKKCMKCGKEGHLKAECKMTAQDLEEQCGYCHEEGHQKGECATKREDERDERAKFKQEKQVPMFQKAWGKTPESQPLEEDKVSMWKELQMQMKLEIKEAMAQVKADIIAEFRKEVGEVVKTAVMAAIAEIKKGLVEEIKKSLLPEMAKQATHPLGVPKRRLETPVRIMPAKKKTGSVGNVDGDNGDDTNKNLDQEMQAVGVEEPKPGRASTRSTTKSQ